MNEGDLNNWLELQCLIETSITKSFILETRTGMRRAEEGRQVSRKGVSTTLVLRGIGRGQITVLHLKFPVLICFIKGKNKFFKMLY